MHLDFKEEYKLCKCICISKKITKVKDAFRIFLKYKECKYVDSFKQIHCNIFSINRNEMIKLHIEKNQN